MKRDMELVRAILLYIEHSDSGVVSEVSKLEGYDDNIVAYHVNMLVEAALLAGIEYSGHGRSFPNWAEVRLTWAGHEFLDAARHDSVWKKFLKQVAEKGGSIPFSVATTLLNAYVRDLFGLT